MTKGANADNTDVSGLAGRVSFPPHVVSWPPAITFDFETTICAWGGHEGCTSCERKLHESRGESNNTLKRPATTRPYSRLAIH